MRRYFGNKDCIEKVKILQRKVQRLGVPQKEHLINKKILMGRLDCPSDNTKSATLKH